MRPNPTRPSGRRSPLAGALFAALLAFPACAQQQPAGKQQEGAAATATPAAGLSADSLQSLATRDRAKGSEQAAVTIVEVSDFQCPYCAQFATTTYRQIDSAYIRPGKAKLIFINYPIPNHAQAWAAHEAALCAGAQGSFWPMHDRIFANQKEWSGQADAVQHFARYASELRLDADAYRRCVEEDVMASLIVNDVMQASGSGISGTPTFIIGGQRVVSGAAPFEQFQQAIEESLSGQGAPQQPPTGTPRP